MIILFLFFIFFKNKGSSKVFKFKQLNIIIFAVLVPISFFIFFDDILAKIEMYRWAMYNENKGNHIKDDIYELDKEKNIYGTQAYVINNKNIEKIYECITDIMSPIDVQYETSIKHDKLTAYVIYPWLFDQNRDKFMSTINLPLCNKLKKKRKINKK